MTEQILNEIVFNTAGAVKAIDALANKLDKYSKDLIKTSQAEDKASQSAKQARAFFDKLAGSTDKASTSAKKLAAATKAATAASRRNTNQVNKQKKSADDLGVSWTSVKRIFAGQIIFRALSAITNQMRDSVGVAQELGVKLAEAITIAPGELALSIKGVERLGIEVRTLSQSFGVDQVELATAAYQVYSNQIGNATESTKFLEQAVLFAKATVTNTANAVDLLSGVINSYGLEAGEAARVSDVFTKAVELGRFRIDDIANSMGRVNPIAAQLGISIEEVAAAFATLTIKGVSPDKAMTQLLATMLKLVKPSTALSKALGQIGFTNIKAATSTLGLVGTLKALVATTDGSVEALGRMFPRVRAIQGILGLVGDEGERFDSIFKEIQNTAEGTTKKFAAFILATDAEEFRRNIQTIKNLFVEDFGKGVIKTVNEVLAALGGIPGAANKIQVAFELIAVAFAGLALRQVILGFIALRAQMAGATLAASGLTAALFRIPFAALAIGAAALGQGLAFLVNQFILGGAEADRMAAREKALEQSTKELASVVADSAGIGLDAVRDAANAQLDAVINSIREQVKAHEELGSRIKFLGQEVTNDLLDELDRRLKAFQDFADDSSTAIVDAAKRTASIDKTIARIKVQGEQAAFDATLRGRSKVEQRRRKDARALSLIKRANLTVIAEERNQLLKTAEAEAKGGRFAKIATDARIKGLEKQKTEIQKTAVIFKGLSPTINKATNDLAGMTAEAKRLGEELAKAVEVLDFSKALNILGRLDLEITNFEEVQKDIETVVGDAFGQTVTGLREGLTNLFADKQPISFKLDQVRKEVTALFKDRPVPLEILLKFGQLGGDVKGATFETILKFLGLQKEQVKTILASVKSDLVIGVTRTVEEARAEIEKILSQGAPNRFGGFSFEGVTPETVATLNTLAAAILIVKEALAVDKGEEISAEKLKTFSQVASTLTPQLDALREQGLGPVADAFEELAGKIQTIENKIGRVKGIGNLSEDVRKFLEELLKTNQVAPGVGQSLDNIGTKAESSAIKANALGNQTSAIGPKAQDGANKAVSALQTIGPAAGAQIPQVNALAAALASLATQRAAAATVATGGQIPAFFAGGGPTQSRGTDTVSVQAAPGEMFVNAASSRRFIPELTAINQGRAPEPRNNSQVTNNSFSGDININVPSGAKIDGRSITQDIRRELRRKTSSLS